MRLLKSNSIRIISLLVFIDVFLSALLLYMVSKKNEAKKYTYYYEYKAKTQELALFCSSDLQYIIQERASNAGEFDYGVFVPPYPCQSCMEEQFLIIKENEATGLTFVIWAPNSRIKEIRAFLCKNNNCQIVSYEEQWLSGKNSIINSLSGLVFFTAQYGMIQDIYLSDSTFPDLTMSFLLEHKNLMTR